MINNLKFVLAMGILLTFCSSSALAQNKKSTPKEKQSKTNETNKTQMDSLSYGLGILLGQNLKQLEIENIDAATLSMAIDDLLKGRDLKMTPEQANMLVSNQMAAAAEKKAGPAIEEGRKFLAENGKKPGVITTASGLQ
ncbi:MAG TPA: FKBP-type peptidyl-prolyl cis-trans isomerase N-terminal domain-containing protein, partial [Saprospiraceae bacterium]|nr:FKBP-type peptidyl-prolyl cis-trans isomerase N-terminal domain-containing protein [Saprospiraceae bacterium]